MAAEQKRAAGKLAKDIDRDELARILMPREAKEMAIQLGEIGDSDGAGDSVEPEQGQTSWNISDSLTDTLVQAGIDFSKKLTVNNDAQNISLENIAKQADVKLDTKGTGAAYQLNMQAQKGVDTYAVKPNAIGGASYHLGAQQDAKVDTYAVQSPAGFEASYSMNVSDSYQLGGDEADFDDAATSISDTYRRNTNFS